MTVRKVFNIYYGTKSIHVVANTMTGAINKFEKWQIERHPDHHDRREKPDRVIYIGECI